MEPTAPPVELAPALSTPTPTPEPTAPIAPPASPAAGQPTPAGVEQPGTPPPAAAVPSPATPPTIAAEVAPSAAIAPEVQEYMAELQTRDDERAIKDTVAILATQFEDEQGMTPEQAKWAAEREVGRAVQHFRANQLQQRRINDALEIGQKYGIDPRQLLGHPNPQAMIQAAMLATSFTKTQSELAALKAENEALKKKLVPPTTYAAPGVSPTPPPGSYLEKLKSGGPLPSAAEIDKFTARYLTGSA